MAGDVDSLEPSRHGLRVAAVLAFVLAVRLVEARLLAPLLYSQELMGLGRLAWELGAGEPLAAGSIREFVQTYQYGHFAQGTLLVQAMAAAMYPLLADCGWSFHAVGVPLELLGLGILLGAFGRRASTPALLLATAPWVFLPAFLTGWQLMPFGNHTEFLWLIPLLAVVLSRAGERLEWLAAVAVLVAVFAYRGALIPSAAAMLVALLMGRRRLCLALVVGVALALGFALVAWGAWETGHPDETLRTALLPRVEGGRTTAMDAARAAMKFLGAPRGLLGGAPWLIALALGAVVSIRRSDGVSWFLAAAALLGLAAPILLAPAHPEYLLPALAAALTLVSRAVLQGGTRLVGVCALTLAVAGVADLGGLASRDLWRAGEGHAPLRLSHELAVRSFAPDDLGGWRELSESDLAGRWVGLSTGGTPNRCLEQPLRLEPGPLARVGEGRCVTWSDGELARWLVDYEEARGPIPSDGLRQVGAGAWIACGRSVACVERAMAGEDERRRGLVVRGARGGEVRVGGAGLLGD